jgi:polyisoprenoid-binding protein YceI
MSRTFSAIAFVLLLTLSAAAQDTWQLDPVNSSAQFAVRHFGISTIRGAFTKVSGSVQYDPANLGKSSIQTTIEAASLNTRVDDNLRSSDYLDVKKYPTLTFQSNKIEAARPGKLKVTGDLTVHGVTKEVVLDADGSTPAMKDPKGRERMGASATTKINRMDFGVSGSPGLVGDDIAITIDIEMIKK